MALKRSKQLLLSLLSRSRSGHHYLMLTLSPFFLSQKSMLSMPDADPLPTPAPLLPAVASLRPPTSTSSFACNAGRHRTSNPDHAGWKRSKEFHFVHDTSYPIFTIIIFSLSPLSRMTNMSHPPPQFTA